jgi:hypothetical protein
MAEQRALMHDDCRRASPEYGGRRRSHPGVGHGELVERGTHRELLAKNGTYTNLVHAQVDGV